LVYSGAIQSTKDVSIKYLLTQTLLSVRTPKNLSRTMY